MSERAPSPTDDVQVSTSKWLMLFHLLPPKPAYFRVKIWRRLQALGAVSVKNSVYVLPRTDGTNEDLKWLLQEILHEGGEGALCTVEFLAGMTDEAIIDLFHQARNEDYDTLAQEIAEADQKFAKGDGRSGAIPPWSAEVRTEAASPKATDRRDQSLGLFDAPKGTATETALSQLESKWRVGRGQNANRGMSKN